MATYFGNWLLVKEYNVTVVLNIRNHGQVKVRGSLCAHMYTTYLIKQ